MTGRLVVSERARGVTGRLALIGVAAGLLSGLLGIGGGIVIVPGLIWAAGLTRHTASGTSLLAILPIAVVSAVTYALVPGGAFDPEASAIFVAGSVAGAVVGARVNAQASERALRMAMAVLSLIFGIRLVIPLGFGAGTEDLPLDAWHVALLLYLGLQGGFMSGLLGVGGGGGENHVRDALATMLQNGVVHGDLSAYNILAAGERLVIIDLPQIVDLVGNLNGMDFLLRDCANICGWFRSRGLEADEHELFSELMAHAF